MLTGDPLLCVAGSGIPSVKIFNVKTGKLVRVKPQSQMQSLSPAEG